jgi:glutaredoxin
VITKRMDPGMRKLLEAFDAPTNHPSSREGLSLRALGDAAELRPLAEGLVAQGFLRRVNGVDAYSRTEDGRLAIAGPLDVTLYTRPGCHLCEEAKAQIGPVLRRFGAHLHEINIENDEVLRQLYALDVPVIFLGRRKVAKHRVDVQQFKRQLEQARRDPAQADD